MTTRLQVLLDEEELEEIREEARRHRQTVSEWVRQTLREARHAGRETTNEDRRRALREAAAGHAFPTADIDQMLREIEQGRAE